MRRRSLRTTTVDLAAAIVLVALYLASLKLHRNVPWDPRDWAAIAIGSTSLVTLVFYHRLSRWIWVVIAGYLVHPLLLSLSELQYWGWFSHHEAALLRFEALLTAALQYDGPLVQGLFSMGLLGTLRSLARQIETRERGTHHEAASNRRPDRGSATL